MIKLRLTFEEIEVRTIEVRATDMVTALNFVEDGAFYGPLTPEQLHERYRGMYAYESAELMEIVGRRVVRIEEVE